MTVVVLKRTSDKLDAVLASVLLVLGVAVFGIYLSAPRLSCVPIGCVGRPYSPQCAREWTFASSNCESSFLSYADTNFHFLLLTSSLLCLCLVSSSIFYGNPLATDLFASFSSIWKLRTNDPVTKEVEWRRRMHLILEQLKSSSLLTEAYAWYHGLGLALDSVTFLLVSLYTLHFFDFNLPTSYFAITRTEDDTYSCQMPNRNLYQWFGLAGVIATFIKTFNRVLCVGFAAGIPGLFGRNMVLYADEIVDRNEEKVYNIQNNICSILCHVVCTTARHLFVLPALKFKNYCQFYINGLGAFKDVDDDVVNNNPMPIAVAEPTPATNGHAQAVEDSKQRNIPTYHHNWSDLLFIMDVMEDNAVEPSDILIFISKSDDLITVLEDKKVDVQQSRLDTTTNTLKLAYTSAGIIENLLDIELYARGGLEVKAWLESTNGRVENIGSGKCPVFPVALGQSNYQVISAVFGDGKMLARLSNFTFNLPSELKERHKKKYGHSIPLAAFTKSDRPLSLNFDIGL